MNNVLKTKLGTDIPITTRGILYLCNYNYKTKRIKVVDEMLFNDSFIRIWIIYLGRKN